MSDTKRPTVTIDYDAKPIEFEAVWRDHDGRTREELEWIHVARAWRDYADGLGVTIAAAVAELLRTGR